MCMVDESRWWGVRWAARLVGAYGCWSCVGVSLLGCLRLERLWAWVSGASLGLPPLDSALNV